MARPSGVDPVFHGALGRMTDVLRHRGPDAAGTHLAPDVILGHRRLSIVDLATGAQPMSNEDGSVWVVFNGEIYNHGALRQKLALRGHAFRTRSDTEVIVHGYEEWGPALVDHLEGMFALVVHDQRNRRLWAARDRLGEKPLFYAMLGDHLHVASEIKALRQSPLWVGEIAEGAIDAYLALGYIPAPNTIYKGVFKLPPAHTLRFDASGLVIERYWDVTDFDVDDRSEAVILDELDSRLSDSVRQRLQSDVAIGAFLSGGIDSSLVLSRMAEMMTPAPVAITVGFADDARNELSAAAATARALGVPHILSEATLDLDASLQRISQCFDEPFADSSAVTTDYLCAAARQHITVALSGDGGDEAFAGYDYRYVPHMREDSFRQKTGMAGRFAASVARAVWPRSRRLPRPFRLYNTLANLSGSPADAFYRDLCFLKPDDHAALRDDAGLRDFRKGWAYAVVRDAYERCPSPDALQKAQYADLTVYMPNGPLVKVDRMSMQHGLEVRCPMLDHRLIEFAFRLRARTKLPGPRSKHLLRRLADRHLSAAVAHRPKQGFEAPLAAWFRGKAGERFEAEVLCGGTWIAERLSISHLRHCLRQHQRNVVDHSYLLWAVWVLQRWSDQAAPLHEG